MKARLLWAWLILHALIALALATVTVARHLTGEAPGRWAAESALRPPPPPGVDDATLRETWAWAHRAAAVGGLWVMGCTLGLVGALIRRRRRGVYLAMALGVLGGALILVWVPTVDSGLSGPPPPRAQALMYILPAWVAVVAAWPLTARCTRPRPPTR